MRRDHVVGFRLDSDAYQFIHDKGKARKTDLAEGRINFSEEVNEFIKDLMSRVNPDAVGQTLMRSRQEHQDEIAKIESKAKELLGTSLDDWAVQASAKEKEAGDELKEQRAIRGQVKHDALEKLTLAWKERHSNGNHYSESQEVGWLQSRFRDALAAVGWTPQECIERMKKGAK